MVPNSEIPVIAIINEDENTIVFDGTVLSIGPAVPASGLFAWYRLAKYRVERVYYGHYSNAEIVVDHLSLTTHELDGIRIGDRVCIAVARSNEIFMRTNVRGIREEAEQVDLFYVGGEVSSDELQCRPFTK